MKKRCILWVFIVILSLTLSSCFWFPKSSIEIKNSTYRSRYESQLFFDDVEIYQTELIFEEIDDDSTFENPLICLVTGKKFAIFLSMESNYEIVDIKCEYDASVPLSRPDAYRLNSRITWEMFAVEIKFNLLIYNNHGKDASLIQAGNLIVNGEEIVKSSGKTAHFRTHLMLVEDDVSESN